jgi:mediator of RNA polymerase II transcription subunit 24
MILFLSDFDESLDYVPDIIKAIDLLMEDTPILDFMDTKCACDTIECLLTELKKQNLVNDKHIKHYTAKRAQVSQSLPKIETQSIVKYVIRVEPPMTGILKTLSKDYNHVQEALLGMLCQVLSGNSFQLISSVATVEGKLKTLVQRLIKCNESSKQVPGETDRAMVTRSSLFDVSFLMLSSIVQTYGSDVLSTLTKKWSSF